METINAIQSIFAAQSDVRFVHKNEESEGMNLPSILGWFRILRRNYQWPLFEAIRYALWLSR